MKKQDLPEIVQASLEQDALEVFLSAFNEALQKGCNECRAYVAAYLALESAGYEKGPSGKWKQKKEQDRLFVKMDRVFNKNEERRQVFGLFSVVEQNGVPVIDSQGDVISEKDLEKSAYKYVKFSRMGDERHDERCKAILIESVVLTKEKQEALGINLGYVGWWGGFEILDDALWAKFKSGEYQSFSIGGRGRYEQFDL